MSSTRWAAPADEADRVWHEPEVIIYNLIVYPEVSSSAIAYDVANRKWYELNLDTIVRDEDWMDAVITKHISDYHAHHGTLPDFNVINTTREGTPTTFEKKPNEHVARRIEGNVHYGRGPSDILPTTTFEQVKQKLYLNRGIDRCVWNGADCIFKRIEFVEDLEAIEREIKTREALLAASEPPGTSIELRFHVLPILAVVNKHSETDEVLGIIMPYGGQSLESLAGGYQYGMGADPEEGLPPKPWPSLPIAEEQIIDLLRGVRELAKAGVVHGDVNDRNTLLTPDNRLVLVDMGEVAPDYVSDVHALGRMMLWALEMVSWTTPGAEDRVRQIATQLLAETGGMPE
ncbi:uncharacterized protein E0L32_004042 [Thyridium curvatum]|uniref:Protein kinase domain-containing protein n=1 Tax=Thyridium curvatum TaxID=1093900 RepID=A0A507B9V7_9PEZI|nr:uncharacterized protein E0L32_004042 [Thyridium curvatum]TPX16393.1 hypothetical protein E0L32_004042 [Thyridium curvatum]